MMQTHFFQYPFNCCGKTDTGRERLENQDAVLLHAETGFFAVSDGMGGLPGGGRTSAVLTRVLPKIVAASAKETATRDGLPLEIAAMLLKQKVQKLSDRMYAMTNHDGRARCGATLSGVWLAGDKAAFINIGDSRGYLLKAQGPLKQITVDHNVAQEMVAWGQLTKEEARVHKTSALLTRYVGMPSAAEVDVFIEDIRPGDTILLCSDGLHGMAGDDAIARSLAGKGGAGELCDALIALANANGGRDNIAVVCLEIGRL